MVDLLLPGFVQQYQPAFPIGYSSRPSVLEYLQHPPQQPASVPIYVFIDRKGAIRAQHLGTDPFFQNEDKNTRAMVESLLKEPAGAGRKKR